MALFLGIFGLACILLAFILDEFVREFNQNTVSYNLLNIFGAGLLLYYGLTIKGWPFVVLNAAWLGVAVVKLGKIVGEGSNRKK